LEESKLFKNMLDELENKGNSAEMLLDSISETKMASLREAVDEISEQIKVREKLHSEMLSDIEKMKNAISNMMPPDNYASAELQRAIVEFRKKLIDAEEIKVQEKLNCFRDIALLKKEMREIIQEMREKESRASLLGDILSK